MTRRRLAALTMLALIGAGCSNEPAETDSGTQPNKAVTFSACMRDNGIKALPDPDASGELTEQGIPATWATAGEGNARSYTMGDGKGGQVDLVTEFGDIAVVAK